MKKVFSHWKTTTMGVIAIVGGVVRLVFAIKSGNWTEESLTTSIGGIMGGIGFLFAADNTAPVNTPKIVQMDDEGTEIPTKPPPTP